MKVGILAFLKLWVLLVGLFTFLFLDCPTAKAEDGASPAQTTNQTTVFKQRVEQQLDTIIFEKVSYDAVPLGDVLKQLQRESKARDPKKIGVNLLILDPPDDRLPNSETNPSLAELTVIIKPVLKNVSLRQLLDFITKITPRPIQYSIEAYGVVFTARLPPKEPKEALHTRTFKLGTKLFAELNTGNPLENCRRILQRDCGVDFEVTAVSPGLIIRRDGAAGRQVFINERLQMLMVRGTLAELDRVEKYVSKRSENGAPPPQP